MTAIIPCGDHTPQAQVANDQVELTTAMNYDEYIEDDGIDDAEKEPSGAPRCFVHVQGW